MARNTSNRLIEQLDSGAHRESVGNVGPAVESANARVDYVGPFFQTNMAANQSGAQLVTTPNSQLGIPAHSSGKVIGIAYRINAPVSAGGASAVQLQATVAPAATLTAAAQGDALAIPSGGSLAPTGSQDESTEVPFSKGDMLGVNVSTSGTFAPTTADMDVYLVVRWNPSPGVPA